MSETQVKESVTLSIEKYENMKAEIEHLKELNKLKTIEVHSPLILYFSIIAFVVLIMYLQGLYLQCQ